MLYGTEKLSSTGVSQYVPTVSTDQLKNLVLGEKQEVTRFSGVPRDYYTEYKKEDAARLTPQLSPVHPYDYWGIRIGSKYGTIFNPKVNIHEYYAPVMLMPWDAYTVTLSWQTRPERYLEYLRLIESAGPNPWVEYVGGKWRDRVTGESESMSIYPVWTVDRFKETIINNALGTTFTLLDIARIDDPQYLEWAYSRVLNSLPEIKSWISEESRVKVRWADGKEQTSKLVGINSQMRTALKRAADGAAVLIRQNMDKLAARTIEVQALTAEGKPVSFIGPEWLNPLLAPSITEEEITRGLATRDVVQPLSPQAVIPLSQVEIAVAQPEQKKASLALPIVLGVAAIGTVAALS
jgi:hypothetical protein